MALVDTGSSLSFPRMPMGTAVAPGATNLLLDAEGEKYAALFRAPKTGGIRFVGFATGAITTGGNLDVRIETVDLTTGNPSGTLQGTNTNVAVTVADTDDIVWKTATLTADASVTHGDLLAVVIVAPLNFNGNLRVVEYDNAWASPYAAHFTTAWAKQTNSACIVIGYSDDAYVEISGLWPITGGLGNQSLTTTSLYGNRISLPFKCQVSGFWVLGDLDGADTILRLYGSDGETVLLSASHSKSVQVTANGRTHFIRATGVATLEKDTAYRIVIGSSGANGSTAQFFDTNSNAVLGAYGNTSTYATQAATQTPTLASWTDTNTRRFMMGVIISQVDDGTGAGVGGGVIGGPSKRGGKQ